MSFLDELGIAPGTVKASDVADQMSKGSAPPDGVYHAVLEAAGNIPNAEGRGSKLVFKIIAGPWEGYEVDEALWKPKGDDPKKDARVKNRNLIFGHRLGLLTRDSADNFVQVAGKHSFADCLGAPCFIELRQEEESYQKDGATKKITKAKLTFEGVLDPADKKCASVPKGTAHAGAGGTAAPPQKPAEKFDNI
jgi:hypothetical protein